MKFTHGAVDSYHSRLARQLGEALNLYRPVLKEDLSQNWKNFTQGKKFRISMFGSVDPVKSSVLVSRYIERGKGGRTFAAQVLVEQNHTYWASWSEEWISAERRQIELIGAGWTFFVSSGDIEPKQFLRAEWDIIANRGGQAGQPHWHLDPFGVDTTQHQASALSQQSTVSSLNALSDLVELPSSTQFAESVVPKFSNMHLGMGGWVQSHSQSSDFARWQCSPSNLTSIEEWSDCVLKYVTREIQKL